MSIINVNVNNNVIRVDPDDFYVCGNADYKVVFDFDSEWDDVDIKTARFIYPNDEYQDVIFSGTECVIPTMSNIDRFKVGVYTTSNQVTTFDYVQCFQSILDGEDEAEEYIKSSSELLLNANTLGVVWRNAQLPSFAKLKTKCLTLSNAFNLATGIEQFELHCDNEGVGTLNLQSMFMGCISVKSILINVNVQDISLASFANLSNTMADQDRLETITFLNVAKINNSISFVNNRTKLKTINGTPLDFSSGSHTASTTFYGATALENIRFAPGKLGVTTANVYFYSDNLTVESLLSILEGLYDRSSTTAGNLSIGSVNTAKLTLNQISIATEKNWTIN